MQQAQPKAANTEPRDEGVARDVWQRVCRLSESLDGEDGVGDDTPRAPGPVAYRSPRVAREVRSFYACFRGAFAVQDEADVAYRSEQSSPSSGSEHQGRGQLWELFCYLGRGRDGKPALRIPLQALPLDPGEIQIRGLA